MTHLLPNLVFRPSKELTIEFAHLFAGRSSILGQAVDAIQPDNSSMAIYGERGVGKTSFARMVRGLLDRKISTDALGIDPPSTQPSFRCIWQTIGPGMKSLEDLLYNLLDPGSRDPDSFAVAFPDIAEHITKRYSEIDRRALTRQSMEEKRLVLDLVHQVEGDFKSQDRGTRVVLFLDELDRLDSQNGLGQLIKSSPFSFVLVGIGESISDIIADHKSAARNLGRGNFRITTLSRQEIDDFFDKSEKAALPYFPVRFDLNFRKLASEDFGGYPAQLQRLGFDALQIYTKQIESLGSKGFTFDENAYRQILNQRINLEGHDKIASDMVHDAVRASRRRWDLLVFLTGDERYWLSRQIIQRTVDSKLRPDWTTLILPLQKKNVVEFDREKDAWRVADPDTWCEVRRLKRIGWVPKEL